MKNRKTAITVIFTVIFTAAVSVGATSFYINQKDDFRRLRKVASIIEKSYVDDFDVKKAEEEAINSVVESIGDKYAVYYNEKNAKETMDYIEGYYVGIGLEVASNTQEDLIEIISAYEGSPAYEAGIRSGDRLISIDGKKYSAKMLGDAVSVMRGAGLNNPVGKEVKLVIRREGEDKELYLKRAKIAFDRVSDKMTDNGIYYVRYTGFAENSEKEFEENIKNLDENKVKGIVIDIRDNPGGEFGSAIKMCDIFLNGGTIMYTKDKSGQKTVYKAKKGACELPLAVLVNGSSASASEIFAGALKTRERAVIVGEKTYGKGVSQTIEYINMFNAADGALKLTTCKNYLSDDTWLNAGVTPDITMQGEKLDIEDIENDIVFRAAAEALADKK